MWWFLLWPLLAWRWLVAGEPEQVKPVRSPAHPAGSRFSLAAVDARLSEVAAMHWTALHPEGREPDEGDAVAAEVTMIRADMLLDERLRITG